MLTPCHPTVLSELGCNRGTRDLFVPVVSEQNPACSQDSLSVDRMGQFETEMESVGMESG